MRTNSKWMAGKSVLTLEIPDDTYNLVAVITPLQWSMAGSIGHTIH